MKSFAIMFATLWLAPPPADGAAAEPPLTPLRRVYLSCHASPWISEPADDPDHKAWEIWPGRTAMVRPLDFEIRRRIHQIMGEAGSDEGLMIIPSYPEASRPATEVDLIAKGGRIFGDRCVVTSPYRVPVESLGHNFAESLERDRGFAETARARGVTDEAFEHEFNTWITAKTWITDLSRKLEANGYTFDPRSVEFVCWGADWRGCAASYPIMMGRALKLAAPIERRWDLIVHDSGPMDIRADLVVGNVRMSGDVRLFIFRSEQGRYCAEFWEGMHGPMDRARQIRLAFPPDSVRCVNVHGDVLHDGRRFGELMASIGCGGHTPHKPTIIELIETLTLDAFHNILVAGVLTEKP